MTNMKKLPITISQAVTSHSVEDAEAKLDATMMKIQDLFKKAITLDTQSRSMQYRGVSELLVFHIEAVQEGEYLDKYYQAGAKKHKRKVNHGINFAPLITAAWPTGETLDTNKKNRWSRAMNGLLKIYESDPSYKTGTAKKFFNLLNKNGLDEYVKYGSQKNQTENDPPDYIADDALVNSNPHQLSSEEVKKLYFEGVTYMSKGKFNKQAKLNTSIPLGDHAMSLVLLRDMGGDEYAVLGATASEKYMKKFIAEKYVSDINATPKALRVLYEAISTQCPPNELKKIYLKLIDKAGSFSDGAVKHAVRRLFYKHSTKQFIMSPIRAQSGVVTIVDPKVPVLKNVDDDVFLAGPSRRKIEEKIISPRKFMRYGIDDLDKNGLIKMNESFTHIATLKDSETADTINVIFAREDSHNEDHCQVIVKEWDEAKACWSISLPAVWIQSFENKFTSKWLNSHGKHANRDHQQMLMLEFRSKSLKVRFYEKDSVFDLQNEVDFKVNNVKGKAKDIRVLSKDFSIAMHALSYLDLTGEIKMFVTENFVAITYETDVAFGQIYIPSCNQFRARTADGFGSYELNAREATDMELASEQFEEEMAEEI